MKKKNEKEREKEKKKSQRRPNGVVMMYMYVDMDVFQRMELTKHRTCTTQEQRDQDMTTPSLGQKHPRFALWQLVEHSINGWQKSALYVDQKGPAEKACVASWSVDHA